MMSRSETAGIDAERQKTDKRAEDVTYPLMEQFYTLQGEGVHTGRAAWFIRLAGCDVQCWWCDVRESWDADRHPQVRAVDIAEEAKRSGAPIAVITGGEPLLHDLGPLTALLKQSGMAVHIETSGSSPITGEFDWITLSPKRFKPPVDDIFNLADELKVVVLTRKDLKWAEENASRCPADTIRLLQPEWDTPDAVPLVIEYVKSYPEWRISLQTHKFMEIP